MKTAVIIFIMLWTIKLLLAAHLHGKENKSKHNFWIALGNVAINVSLFWWAGFFN